MKNKEDIEIKCDHSISNGIIQLELEENKPLRIEISIHNLSQSEPRELLHCEMLKRIRVFQLDDQHKITESQATISIPPGRLFSWGEGVQSEARELLHCEILKRIWVFQLNGQHKITESQATISIPPGRLFLEGGVAAEWGTRTTSLRDAEKDPSISTRRPTQNHRISGYYQYTTR